MFIETIILACLFAGSSAAFSQSSHVAPYHQQDSVNADGIEGQPSNKKSSRKLLFIKTGLIVIPTPKIPSDYFLDTLTTVMINGLSDRTRKKLTRLQYVMTDDSISRDGVDAYYSHDLNALIIGKTSAEESNRPMHHLARTWSVIAHEIGHAFVMSNLSAERLAFLARRFGPWRFEKLSPGDHLLSPRFFIPHPLFGAPAGAINELENSPSRYALQNIHEWFAECFSAALKEKLRRQGLLPEIPGSSDMNVGSLSATLKTWFHENITD